MNKHITTGRPAQQFIGHLRSTRNYHARKHRPRRSPLEYN